MNETSYNDSNQMPPVPPSPQGPKKKNTGLIITVISLASVFFACGIGALLSLGIFTFGESNVPESVSSSLDLHKNYSLKDVPETMDIETPELTSDLDFMLEYALLNAGCSGKTVEVTDLTKESTTKPKLVDNTLITSEATGQATISYQGHSETVTYTSYYYLDDPDAQTPIWFIYDFKLSSYALFPPALQQYMNTAEGNGSTGSEFDDATPVLAA